MCMSVGLRVCLWATCLLVSWGTRKGVRLPGVRMTDGCELPDVGAENHTWVLYKSSNCS